MKVTLYMAMSLNGYIAEENGSEDFLSREHWEKFCGLAEECGNFVVGRKTYEAVKAWNEEFDFDDLKGIQKVVISQDEAYRLGEGYMLAVSPRDALEKLRGCESVLVTGGASINSAFIQEKLLDEVILNIEPALLGKGLPLFSPADFLTRLELVSSAASESGIVTLAYRIKK